MILNCSSCGASFKVDTALLGANGRSVRCGSCGHSWHQMPPEEELTAASGEEEAFEEARDNEAEERIEETPEPEPQLEDDPLPELEEVIEEDDELEIEDVVEDDDEPEPAEHGEEDVEYEDEDEDPEPRIEVTNQPDPTLDKLDEQRERVQAHSSVIVSERKSPARALGWTALVLLIAVLVGILWAGKSQIIALAPGTVRFYEMAGLHAGVGQGLDLRDVISERRVVDGERKLVVEGTIVNVSETPLDVPTIKASLTNGEGEELSHWTFTADSDTLPPGGFTTFETSTADPPDEGNLSLAFIEGGQSN